MEELLWLIFGRKSYFLITIIKLKGNEAREIVAKVDKAMYDHIVSLTGKQVNIGQTGLEKIKKMETFLLALEAKKEKENVCLLFCEEITIRNLIWLCFLIYFRLKKLNKSKVRLLSSPKQFK